MTIIKTNIQDSKDFLNFLNKTIEDVKNGKISPQTAGAIAKLADKVIKVLIIEMGYYSAIPTNREPILFYKEKEEEVLR